MTNAETTRRQLSSLAADIWNLPEERPNGWRLVDTTGGLDDEGNPQYQAWYSDPDGDRHENDTFGLMGNDETGWTVYFGNEPVNDEDYDDFESGLRRVVELTEVYDEEAV